MRRLEYLVSELAQSFAKIPGVEAIRDHRIAIYHSK
jgi:hypothetical protein